MRRSPRPSMAKSHVTHDVRRLRLWECLRHGMGCVMMRGPSQAWLWQAVSASKRVRKNFSRLSVRLRAFVCSPRLLCIGAKWCLAIELSRAS